MTYAEALAYIGATGRFGIKMGLERTRALLQAVGSPDRGLRGVLVGGTNGKGSVCAGLVSVLVAAGYRVGSMPKPHLQTYTERICIDGKPISKRAFARVVDELRPAVVAVARKHGEPTEFEMLTAAAIKHLRDQAVDLLVCEVGMGGRLDSTNVLELGVKVITGVALDHQQYLGDSIAAIAVEKAGIIHGGDYVVTAALAPAAARVVAARCAEVGAELERMGAEWEVVGERDMGWRGGEVELSGRGQRLAGLRTPLVGAHQRRNAALAAVAALAAARHHGLDLSPAQLRQGLAATRWPGRLEVVPGRPRVVIDGGHNPDAVAGVVTTVRELAGVHPVSCVFGAMADKDWRAMLALLPPEWPAIFTAVEEARASPPGELLAEARRLGRQGDAAVAGVGPALRVARGGGGGDRIVLVLGSLYLAGAARDALHLPGLGA